MKIQCTGRRNRRRSVCQSWLFLKRRLDIPLCRSTWRQGAATIGAMTLALLSTSCGNHKKPDEAAQMRPGNVQGTKGEVLGEAQIVVYAKGKKTVLDSRSPHLREMQLACEELMISSFSEFVSGDEIKNLPSPDTVRKKGWAIEVIYEWPVPQRKLGFAQDITRLLSVAQFLIPLTGQLTSITSDEGPYTAVFPFERIVHRGGRTETIDWASTNSHRVGTRKRVAQIKTLLKRFGMDVSSNVPLKKKGK